MADSILIHYEDNRKDAEWVGSFKISLLCKGEEND